MAAAMAAGVRLRLLVVPLFVAVACGRSIPPRDVRAQRDVLLAAAPSDSQASSVQPPPTAYLCVLGSVNMDVIIQVDRLPRRDETVASRGADGVKYVPGGKGANQAAAVALLSHGTGIGVRLACQFGRDVHAAALEEALVACGVDLSAAARCPFPSGQGFVFLELDGSASSVVVPGANGAWPDVLPDSLRSLLRGARAVLLQREIPEAVNEAVAAEAAAAGVAVFQDVGGEDRPMTDAQLRRTTYLMPNQSELERLTGLPAATQAEAVRAAAALQARGARNVVVTLGARGSMLLDEAGRVSVQTAAEVPGGVVADATAAGDAYRAAFALAVVEARPVSECLRFASAAGAIAVSRVGAVPSLPRRRECDELCARTPAAEAMPDVRGGATAVMRGGASDCSAAAAAASQPRASPAGGLRGAGDGLSQAMWDNGHAGGGVPSAAVALPILDSARRARGGQAPAGGGLQCTLGFASRLNSMRDGWRAEWGFPNDVLGWVGAQGRVRGLSLVDFNYPQHLAGVDLAQVKQALQTANLRAGAICMRYTKEHQRGGFTNPDPELRRRAIQMALDGCGVARQLGASELVVWSAYDGYDYNMQADYPVMWARVVDAFREICDAFPDIKISLEFKPTDENTRFFAVPTTGAALLLAHEVDRPNFGLTLDVGHCIMAGENPAQSAAMVGARGKLFGVQLNDGHSRLAAEDGLMFGSVHRSMALELMLWLRRTRFDGHLYFDTFPRNEDPIAEAEYNIRAARALWARAGRLEAAGVQERVLARQDALAALELLDEMERPLREELED